MSEMPARKPSPFDKLLNRAFNEATPLNCQIELTYRCNHLCSFCYNSPTGEREMTTPQIFEVLRKVADLDVLYCTLTGGEAMCHKDFYKIAAEVGRLGLALRIYSNGYLLGDEKVVRKIKALNPLEVEISLHGARPETHDALTRINSDIEPGSAHIALATSRCTKMAAADGGQSLSRKVRRIGMAA